MNRISTVKNKLLPIACALSALFCVAMLAWALFFPEKEYQQSINAARDRQAQAEESIAQQTEKAQKKLEELRVQKETVSSQLSQLQAEKLALDEEYAALKEKKENIGTLPEQVMELRQSYGEKIRQLEEKILAGEIDAKICYLTFDDGPNNLTADIVAKLAEHEVFATFFTIGSNSAGLQTENLRAEMAAGHTIANHTFSHAINWGLYFSIDEFTRQVTLQDEKVFEATGFHTDLFRFPSGSVMCPFMGMAEEWLEENGYKWVDWNANAWDAGAHGIATAPAQIAQNIRYTTKDQPITVVLCHDFNYNTYSALDIIIPEFKEQGYIFLPMLPQSIMLEEPLPVV